MYFKIGFPKISLTTLLHNVSATSDVCCMNIRSHDKDIISLLTIQGTLKFESGQELESYSKVGVTFNHVGGSLNLFKYHHGGCLNNSVFSNLGLYATFWACFMCHHELWPSSVSHPISSLNSSLAHWGWDKMDTISQTTVSNAFSWMKMLEFRLIFTEVCS